MSYYGPVIHPRIPEQHNSLTSADVQLDVRQHPVNALVTPENKEKTRKPIDPPPIVQLKVTGQGQRDWLVNPFLFMNAVLVSADDERTGQPKTLQGNQLLGQNVSSLHRLKDIDNKDGGFFVFGDISCRRTGTYRLQFNLFNYESEEVNFLKSVVSSRFRVMTAKEYPGLQESTHLSRTFSDQGVRLRLRKENRQGGMKRTYAATAEVYDLSEARPNPLMHTGGPVQTYAAYDQAGRPYNIKRQRSDSDYALPQGYPAYGGSAMQQYGPPGSVTYRQPQPQPPQNEHQAHMSGMIPIQQGMMPGWQQSQHGTPVGSGMNMSGQAYYGANANSGQAPRTPGYPHTSPIYTGRSGSDVYAGMSSLPTPTSEQSMGSTQSSLGTYAHPTQLGAPLPSREHHAQQYDLSNPPAQYPPQPHSHYPTTQYEQHPSSESVKLEGNTYGDSPNIYNPPSQPTYGGGEGFSSSDLPLNTGMLNREYSGAYQQEQQQAPQAPPPPTAPQEPDPYTEMAADGNNVPGYGQGPGKTQQPASYPTPHHTSPTSHLHDHG